MLCLFPAAAGFGSGGTSAELEAARTALARHDGIAAEAALRRAMEQGATREAVAARMGEAELLQGDLVEARHWLGAGQFVPGEQALGFRMLGRLEMEEGDLPAAGQAFDRALALTPGDSLLWVDIGRLRYRGGEQIQAIAAVEKAVKLDARNVRALEFYGQIVRDSIGPVAALGWFERARRTAPDDLDVLGQYAATLGELGRAKEMLAVTRHMIELAPRNPQAFYLQAVLAARADKNGLARRLMWRTGDAFRDMPAAMMLNGILEYRSGNLATAADLFERLWQRQPDNRQAALLLARTMYEAGDMRALVDRFAPLAGRGDASPYLLTLVGRAYEALGERDKAAPFLDRAAAPRAAPHLVGMPGPIPVEVLEPHWRGDPYHADNVIPLVRQLIATGNAARAVAVAEQALTRFPGSADAQMLAGDARMASGAYQAALEHYRLSAHIRLSRMLLARMAAAYVEAGQLAQANALLDGYVREHPMDGRAAGWAAGFAARLGNPNRAGRLLDHALKQQGAGRDPELLAQRAMNRLQSGDKSGARKDALTAYGLQRANAELALVLAKVLAASAGSGDSAVRALEQKAAAIGGEG